MSCYIKLYKRKTKTWWQIYSHKAQDVMMPLLLKDQLRSTALLCLLNAEKGCLCLSAALGGGLWLRTKATCKGTFSHPLARAHSGTALLGTRSACSTTAMGQLGTNVGSSPTSQLQPTLLSVLSCHIKRCGLVVAASAQVTDVHLRGGTSDKAIHHSLGKKTTGWGRSWAKDPPSQADKQGVSVWLFRGLWDQWLKQRIQGHPEE